MKSFNQYITEQAVSKDEIEQEIEETKKFLQTELEKLFPEDEGWRVYTKTAPMDGGVAVTLYNEKTATNRIPQNSNSFSTFMMHLTDGGNRFVDLDKVSWEKTQGPREPKFRKISSKKSVEDANQKLVNWFRKNLDAYRSLENIG